MRSYLHTGAQPPDRGRLELAFDPKIGDAYRRANTGYRDMDLWETVAQMTTCGPGTDVIEVPETGYTPMLKSTGGITSVRGWLRHQDERVS